MPIDLGVNSSKDKVTELLCANLVGPALICMSMSGYCHYVEMCCVRYWDVYCDWNCSLIYGFISKEDTKRKLIGRECGTFLLRFSETDIEQSQKTDICGCLSLAFVETNPETGGSFFCTDLLLEIKLENRIFFTFSLLLGHVTHIAQVAYCYRLSSAVVLLVCLSVCRSWTSIVEIWPTWSDAIWSGGSGGFMEASIRRESRSLRARKIVLGSGVVQCNV